MQEQNCQAPPPSPNSRKTSKKISERPSIPGESSKPQSLESLIPYYPDREYSQSSRKNLDYVRRSPSSKQDSFLLSGLNDDTKRQGNQNKSHIDKDLTNETCPNISEVSQRADLQRNTMQQPINLSNKKQQTDYFPQKSPINSRIGGQQSLVKNQTIIQSKQYHSHYNLTPTYNQILQQRRQTLYKALRNTFTEARSPAKSQKVGIVPEAQIIEDAVPNKGQVYEERVHIMNEDNHQSEYRPSLATKNSLSLNRQSFEIPEQTSMIVNTSFDRRPSINDPIFMNYPENNVIEKQQQEDAKTVVNASEPMDIQSHIHYIYSQGQEGGRQFEVRTQIVIGPSAQSNLSEKINRQEENGLPSQGYQTQNQGQKTVIEIIQTNQEANQDVQQHQQHHHLNQLQISIPITLEDRQIIEQKEFPQQSHEIQIINAEQSQHQNTINEQNYAQNINKLEFLQPKSQSLVEIQNEATKYERIIKAENTQQEELYANGNEISQNQPNQAELYPLYSQSPNYLIRSEREKSIHNSPHPMIMLEAEEDRPQQQVLIEEPQSKSVKKIQGSPKRQNNHPSLSNIFVHNSYNPHEKPMNIMPSLEEMNQKIPAPLFPPCISISINRYNEISLNIFNNNLNQSYPEKRPEEVSVKQGTSHQQEPQRQEASTEINEVRKEISNQKIMKNQPLEKDKNNRTIQISSSFSENHRNDTATFNISTQEKEIQTSKYISLESSEDTQKEPVSQTCKRIQMAADAYLSIANLESRDDESFEEIVKPHVARKFATYPTSQVGQMLFKDGLFLTAIARLSTHACKTPVMTNYVFEYFNSAFNVEYNQFIFQEATERAKNAFEKYIEEKYMDIILKGKDDRTPPVQEPIIRTTIQEMEMPLDQLVNKSASKAIKLQRLSLNSCNFSVSEQINKPPEKQKQTIQSPKSTETVSAQQEKIDKTLSIINSSTQSDNRMKLNKIQQEQDKNEKKQEQDEHQKRSHKKKPKRDTVKISDKQYKFDVVNQPQTSQPPESKEPQKKEIDSNSKSNNSRDSSDQVPRDSRFRQLYQKYLDHRKSNDNTNQRPNSSDKAQSLPGILKSKSTTSVDQRHSLNHEEKKNRHVVFNQNPVVQCKQESSEEIPSRAKRSGKRMKIHDDDSFEDDHPPKKRESRRRKK